MDKTPTREETEGKEMKDGDKVLMLPKGRKKDLDADEVIMTVSRRELNERKITEGSLVLLGADGHNASNQLRFVKSIRTSKDFPKGIIAAEGQCIIHVKSIPNTIVRSGFTYGDRIRKKHAISKYLWSGEFYDEVVTGILVYDLKSEEYTWLRNPWPNPIETKWENHEMADSALRLFQCHIDVDVFKDFTDKYGAIWFKELRQLLPRENFERGEFIRV